MGRVHDVAWLAGLFEGEGCIGLLHGCRPTVQIGMTDEDVVRHAHAIAGVGVVGPVKPGKRGKPMWMWRVGRADEAVPVLELILPLLGMRRAARAREVLEAYRSGPALRRLRTHCKRGHPLTGDNVREQHTDPHTATRICRACAVINTQLSQQRRREGIPARSYRRKQPEGATP